MSIEVGHDAFKLIPVAEVWALTNVLSRSLEGHSLAFVPCSGLASSHIATFVIAYLPVSLFVLFGTGVPLVTKKAINISGARQILHRLNVKVDALLGIKSKPRLILNNDGQAFLHSDVFHACDE